MEKLPKQETVDQWFKDNGDKTLRLKYNLNKDSIVIDGGGYIGDWSFKIYDLYKPKIFIFEPVKKFFEIIENSKKEGIEVINSGLSNKNQTKEINILSDGSSIHRDGEIKESVSFVSLSEFIKEKNIKNIDLIKLNVEGDEFDVLEDLIEKDLIKTINNIQIQFHDIPELNSIKRRKEIIEFLSKTHTQTYCYEFVWENWVKK